MYQTRKLWAHECSFVAARLYLGTFRTLRVLCLGLLYPLWCFLRRSLLHGLSASGILRRIFPQCADLGMVMSEETSEQRNWAYMLHGVLIGLSRVIRQVGLHVLFDKQVVCGGSTLCLLD